MPLRIKAASANRKKDRTLCRISSTPSKKQSKLDSSSQKALQPKLTAMTALIQSIKPSHSYLASKPNMSWCVLAVDFAGRGFETLGSQKDPPG